MTGSFSALPSPESRLSPLQCWLQLRYVRWRVLSLWLDWVPQLLFLLCLVMSQFSSVSQSCLTLGDPVDCSMPGLPVHHQLPEFTQTHVHWVSEAIQTSHPLSSFPSIRVFSNESTLHIRWPKYWSFSFSISPSNEHPGLIFFRMDWLDLLVVQGTLKSLFQHHSSKASILQCLAFFIEVKSRKSIDV